ncbi:hypothetical protein [Sphingomonas sp.]|uniref:hypothetical protein n=1 Tax=Sphingomonas sp. TaxID=28214 RepID=UPI0035C83DFD
MIAALLLAAAPVGVWESWGAFRRDDGDCYAIAAPARSGAASRVRPFASVASRWGRDRRNRIFFRLSTRRTHRGPVTLSVGERRFTLAGNATAAWAPDAATDLAIVQAMRGQRSMSVAAVSERGRPFADTYALPGAATAIDAAALACAGR